MSCGGGRQGALAAAMKLAVFNALKALKAFNAFNAFNGCLERLKAILNHGKWRQWRLDAAM